jgi:hypothetical protein
MKSICKISLALVLILSAGLSLRAQVKLQDIPFNLDDILGKSKLLSVKKGFNPIFSIGNYQINKVGILGENMKGVKILGDILGKKGVVADITKMYKTYKTGLVVFKTLSVVGTGVAAYSTIRGLTADNKFDDGTVKKLLFPALGTLATGVLTKVLTKAASYKAVDMFNGVARKKIKDILSIQPASSTLGAGIYVKL